MNYLGMALAVAIASTAGCAMHDRVSKAQSEGVGLNWPNNFGHFNRAL